MKRALTLLLFPLLLCGCHFDAPIYPEPKPLDKALTGIWQHEDGRLIIIPIGDDHHMIHTPENDGDGMFYIASLGQDNLMQLQIVASSDEVPDEIDSPYTLVHYTIKNDTLTYRVIEPKAFKGKETPAAVRAHIEASSDDLLSLFGDETMTFKRYVHK